MRVTLRLGPIKIRSYMVVMPRTCRFNLLLGNEIMTVLQGDILRSKGVVRFQYASTIVSLQPRTASDVLFTHADMPDGWVNRVPPSIELPKNGRRTVRPGQTTVRMPSTVRF